MLSIFILPTRDVHTAEAIALVAYCLSELKSFDLDDKSLKLGFLCVN